MCSYSSLDKAIKGLTRGISIVLSSEFLSGLYTLAVRSLHYSRSPHGVLCRYHQMMLNQDVTTAWDGLPSEGLQVQVLCPPGL